MENENIDPKPFLEVHNEAIEVQMYQLKYDILQLEKEKNHKNEKIKEIMNCKVGFIESNEELSRAFNETSIQAELAVFQVKANNARNELIAQTIENENNIQNIKALKVNRNLLLEANARQKSTIDALQQDVENFRQFQDQIKSLIDQYLKTIDEQQKDVDRYKHELELTNRKFGSINEAALQMKRQSIKANNDLEEIVHCVSSGEEMVDVDSAIDKVKGLINENKTLKSQLALYQKQTSSFECEHKISRETIVRLSNELKILKSSNDEYAEKINMVSQKLTVNTDHDRQINDHINCLASQLSEMRKALTESLEKNYVQSEQISQLMQTTKYAIPLSECIENLDSFIIKAEDILAKNKNGITHVQDATFLIQCIRQLQAHLKNSDSE